MELFIHASSLLRLCLVTMSVSYYLVTWYITTKYAHGWAVLSLFWLHRPLVGSWKSFTNIAQGCIIGTAAVIWHENLTQYKPQKNALTHRSLGYHMATDIWVNISSGNDLLSADNKQSLEPMLNYHKWSSVASTCGQFHRKCWRYHSITRVQIFQCLKLSPYLPGAK